MALKMTCKLNQKLASLVLFLVQVAGSASAHLAVAATAEANPIIFRGAVDGEKQPCSLTLNFSSSSLVFVSHRYQIGFSISENEYWQQLLQTPNRVEVLSGDGGGRYKLNVNVDPASGLPVVASLIHTRRIFGTTVESCKNLIQSQQ